MQFVFKKIPMTDLPNKDVIQHAIKNNKRLFIIQYLKYFGKDISSINKDGIMDIHYIISNDTILPTPFIYTLNECCNLIDKFGNNVADYAMVLSNKKYLEFYELIGLKPNYELRSINHLKLFIEICDLSAVFRSTIVVDQFATIIKILLESSIENNLRIFSFAFQDSNSPDAFKTSILFCNRYLTNLFMNQSTDYQAKEHISKLQEEIIKHIIKLKPEYYFQEKLFRQIIKFKTKNDFENK